MSLLSELFGLLLLILFAQAQFADVNGTHELETFEKRSVLSRRKRFIVFAEGSSFQLVFCTTYPMIFTIGDIFLYGSTAALAWELPQDPYSPYDHRADPLHRRVDTQTIYFTDENGKVIEKRPYKRKPIVNPAFAKRSVDGPRVSFKKVTVDKFKIDRKQMHNSENKREYLKSERMAQRTVEFHRSSRASLYQKIETMLHGLGANGKHCVLKTLCLVGKSHENLQGSFFQEILRAVFTLPKNSAEDKYKAYDAALAVSGSCDDAYPECNGTPLDPTSPTLNY